jgi:hypothetical protein
MTMPTPAFPVYDADNHLYEPEEAFIRHLPQRFRRDFYFVDVEGRRKLVIAGMLSEYIPNPTLGGPGPPTCSSATSRTIRSCSQGGSTSERAGPGSIPEATSRSRSLR